MTSPEQAGRPEYATQAELANLYVTASKNSILKGVPQDHKLGRDSGIIPDPNSPWPHGVNFQRSISGSQLSISGDTRLAEIVERRDIGLITFQFMTELERIDDVVDRLEYIPASLAVLLQHRPGDFEVYVVENRNVDGRWTKVTDRPSPELSHQPDVYTPDDIAFHRDETIDFTYIGEQLARFPAENQQ